MTVTSVETLHWEKPLTCDLIAFIIDDESNHGHLGWNDLQKLSQKSTAHQKARTTYAMGTLPMFKCWDDPWINQLIN